MTDNMPPADVNRSAQPKRRQQRLPQRPFGIVLIVIALVLGVISAGFQIVALRNASVALEQQTVDERSAEHDPVFAELFAGFNEQLRRGQQQQAALRMWIYSLTIPLNLVLAIGLWRLKSWARQLMVAVGVLGVMLALLIGTSSISAIINFLIIIYLLRPHVRSAFEDGAVVQRSRLLS